MKKSLFLLIIFCSLHANAQPYSISFSGTGLSTVKVQNLTTGVIVNVPAGDVLLLSTPTGISEINKMKSSRLKVYPNPMIDKSTLEVFPPLAGDAIISVFDMSGNVLTQVKCYLENCTQEFSLSGIKNGLHLVKVHGNGYQFSEKLISNGKSNGIAVIAKLSNNIQVGTDSNPIKGSKFQSNVDMAYNNGERLKYTAISGNNSTVVTDVPDKSKTILFDFFECTDGCGQNYPIVQIGNQIWMAENLKTTCYSDGTSIPSGWNDPYIPLGNSNKPEYWFVYNSTAEYYYNYGRLYTGWAVYRADKNICPSGWHVSTDVDWNTLNAYLQSNGLGLPTYQLKDNGPGVWGQDDPLATNATGFTARPGGERLENYFYNAGNVAYFWVAPPGGETFGSLVTISTIPNAIQVITGGSPFAEKYYSLSVRCVKN